MEIPSLLQLGVPVVQYSGPFAGATLKKPVPTCPGGLVAGTSRATSSSAAPPPPTFSIAGEELPAKSVSRIPTQDARILQFLLHFLSEKGLPQIIVFINGGYVRDLLLGKEPDDLDLSLYLRECPEDITVAGLLEQLPDFAKANPALGIVEVKLATILSNESKDKQLDTFKAHFTDSTGKKVEVDVMPTIGEETYNDDNRIPIRDQRGLPEQDALRRDLTIGALLLKVSKKGSDLMYELYDFYGGVKDIQNGVLRSPFPMDKTVEEVKKVVLRGESEVALANKLKLFELDKAMTLQVLWWAKVLMDDPVRICRALRFAAKFKFRLHDTFWLSTPFALEALRSKVAGSRKNTEYHKLAGYGFPSCLEFFELAFDRRFGPEKELRLASSLFGGKDEKGRPRLMSQVSDFDVEAFRALASRYSHLKDESELSGGLLAVAIAVADLEKGSKSSKKEEFGAVCDGMCVSNPMREAGTSLFLGLEKLLASPAVPGRLDDGFSKLCNISPKTFALHVKVWEALQAVVSKTLPPELCSARRTMLMALVDSPCTSVDAKLVMQLREAEEALSFERPPVRGGVLCTPGVLDVPAVLRQKVSIFITVALRLLRDARDLETGEQLSELFSARPGFKEALAPEVWFESDGKTLREEFQPPKKGGKK